MKKKLSSLILLIFLILSLKAKALLLTADYEQGENFQTQNYSLNYDKEKSSDYSLDGFYISIGKNYSKVDTTNNQGVTSYTTDSLNLGFIFQLPCEIEFTLLASGSNTSETSYLQTNLGGLVSYSNHYAEDKYWGLNYSFVEGTISQEFEFTILSQKFTREVNLSQYEYYLSLFWNPDPKYNLSIGYWYYEYDKSKDDLELALQSRFINNRASQVAYSISGLLDSKYNVALSVSLAENWDARIGFAQSKLVAAGLIIQDSEFKITYLLDAWMISLGTIQTYNESQTNNSYMIQLGYDWI